MPDNPPLFYTVEPHGVADDHYATDITLRDLFALACASGRRWYDPRDDIEGAERCYAVADAMLAERAKAQE